MKTAAFAAALAATLAGGCAGTHLIRKPQVAQRCHDDELDGPVTLAATPDTAPYGADPFKSSTCGAPPR